MDIIEELIKKDREKLLAIDEQSRNRDWAEDYATGLATTVIKHLVCVLLFGVNCPALSHWCSELDGWFQELSDIRLKPNNKKIKEKDLHNWMCDEFLTQLSYKNKINWVTNKEQQFEPVYRQVLEDSYTDFILWYKNLLSICAKGEYSEEVLINAIYDWYENH